MSHKEIEEYIAKWAIFNRVPIEKMAELIIEGWRIDDEGYSMELIYDGYPLVVEFCIGDFCTYPCSKRNHWLLEAKVQNMTFDQAMESIYDLKLKIDAGHHWPGEDD